VSVWEIVLKVQTGKLKLPAAASVYVRARLHYYGIRPLSVTLAHVFAVEALPPHHRDPFDRMLIAQGQAEGLAIVTHDPQIGQYSVETIW
jgi:PIN domain nuclease of toxin-antitoxin system